MHPEDVLNHPAARLGDVERRSCFTNGYLALDGAISPSWISRLRDATREIVERSRAIARNDGAYVLEDRHGADSFAYTSAPIDGPYRGAIVRGQPARYACFDARPCELPPDWARAGYAGPWELQKNAETAGGA